MIFTDLLKLMVEKKASDLFITASAPPSIKLDGSITPVTSTALTSGQARDLAFSIMNEGQRREFEATKECNFAIHPENIGRFRVNVFVQQGMVGMVLRTIQTYIPSLEELYLPKSLSQLSMEKRGLIIFVGGTGTGKTTSQASMLDFRNKNSKGHIVTVEDPIEFVHQHKGCIVTQREVGVDTESFEVALINSMRQAPDLIQIGEVRTRETMDNAIVFSETGHLCFATLHANNTYQALDRIINFFPPDRREQLLMDLSMNLKALVSQRLIPIKGRKGRVPAVEIMINTALVADLILRGDMHKIHDVVERSQNIGMQTFDQSIFDLHERELITYEDALKNAESRNNMRLKIKLESEGAKNQPPLGETLQSVTV